MSPPSSTIPIPIGAGAPLAASAYSPAAYSYGPTLSSSAGKSKRPSSISKTRRLSTSNQLRAGASALSQSVPSGPLNNAGRARSTSLSTVPLPDDEFDEAGPDGQPLPPASGGKQRKEKGQTYECEKCAKVYRHSTCLTKHRWVRSPPGSPFLRHSHPDLLAFHWPGTHGGALRVSFSSHWMPC